MISLALLAAVPLIVGFGISYGVFRLLNIGRDSGSFLGWSVLAAAATWMTTAIAIYVLIVSSLCAVSVVNTGSATVDVTVLAETQYVGKARLAPGERMFRFFIARTEGAMKVVCAKSGDTKSVTEDFDYVTGGMPAYYSMTVSSCAMMRGPETFFL